MTAVYQLHLGCPHCGGELRHVSTDGEPWSDTIGATAKCPVCSCVVTITVEMTWKAPHQKGRGKMTKLPLGPLMKAMRCETANELGAMTGLSRAAVQRLKCQGVPIHRADALAVMCGVHAAEVWGDEFYSVLKQAPT